MDIGCRGKVNTGDGVTVGMAMMVGMGVVVYPKSWMNFRLDTILEKCGYFPYNIYLEPNIFNSSGFLIFIEI